MKQYTITIPYDGIIQQARLQLSVIGKHNTAAKGDSLFSTAQLTAAESDALRAFCRSAVQGTLAQLSPLVAECTPSDTSLSVTVCLSQEYPTLASSAQACITAMVLAATMQHTLAVTIPALAAQYAAEAQARLADLARIIYTRRPPQPASYNIYNCNGSISSY